MDALVQKKLLRVSVRGSYNDIQRIVTEEGANVNAPDNDGNRPLHYAARYGKEAAALALIGTGAKIDAKNKLGQTPLFGAVEHGHASVVRALIDRGATVDSPDKHGQLPLDRALARGDTEIAGMLKEAMQHAKQSLGKLSDAELLRRRQSVEKVASLLDAELSRRRKHSGQAR